MQYVWIGRLSFRTHRAQRIIRVIANYCQLQLPLANILIQTVQINSHLDREYRTTGRCWCCLLLDYQLLRFQVANLLASYLHAFFKQTCLSLAPFTLLCACGDPAPILRILLCVKVSDAVSGEISLRCWSALEVVSVPYCWRTGSVWMDKLVARSGGVPIVQSDNCTGPSLNLK